MRLSRLLVRADEIAARTVERHAVRSGPEERGDREHVADDLRSLIGDADGPGDRVKGVERKSHT